ncbi:MAG TPA: thioredoxin domain-containing protein [Candidatus Eisenbacteria bacterium]|nr:thioredoxin domain-containing protein [Candidatus Eisenbacteria bacterium]
MSAPARNRLAREKSPYLLQHAGNPVDWYPWGEEAFAKAAGEEKPIFLSIGYSTCHWCHVMERESFETEEIGRILNEHFVAIKVDREERPDVDHIYMTVCQALTGSGGWPLTVFLTPAREPFFAGTYFPPETRFGRPGLRELLYQIVGAWESQRDQILTVATQIVDAIRPNFAAHPGERLDEKTMRAAFEDLAARYDAEQGGFGTAPKFPTPHQLTFLLRYWNRTQDGRALAMVEGTLQAMRRGGIYDQVGFGFHRYATDREWRVPHFEKMLYDQALLLDAYVEAYQATGQSLYAGVAGEIVTYLGRRLMSPEGAFYSAEDADSEGEEGKFYVWTRDEIDRVLGAERGALYARAYGIEKDGNWVDEAHGTRPGTNIPYLDRDPAALAEELASDPAALALELDGCRAALEEARERRPRPHRDDKILTAWNGLMAASLAKAARALDRPAYAAMAGRALEFVKARLVRGDGRLLARYRDGEAAHAGYLDDYAFVLRARLELFEATSDPAHLEEAVALAREMDRLFWDTAEGGYFFTGQDAEPLLARTKESYDGAIPSGNSVAASALLRLSRMTGDPWGETRGRAVLDAFAGSASSHPTGHACLLGAVDLALGPAQEIVIAGAARDAETEAMVREVGRRFLPRAVLLRAAPETISDLRRWVPALASFPPIEKSGTAYLCEGYHCLAPCSTAHGLAVALQTAGPAAS